MYVRLTINATIDRVFDADYDFTSSFSVSKVEEESNAFSVSKIENEAFDDLLEAHKLLTNLNSRMKFSRMSSDFEDLKDLLNIKELKKVKAKDRLKESQNNKRLMTKTEKKASHFMKRLL